jgi:hypothetical protein
MRTPCPLPRATLMAGLFTAWAVGAGLGCVPPSNPCDPDADEALQARGTRIAGIVVDQGGAPAAGVLVTLSGRTETIVTGESGGFVFKDIPPASSYEIVAAPAAPAVGGRARTDALVCGGALDDVEVRIVVPPESPELEIVRASGDRRLFAAFGGIAPAPVVDVEDFFADGVSYRGALDVSDDCALRVGGSAVAYRAQVRAPFEGWKDAVLAPFPWIDPPGDGVPDEAFLDRIDDGCARAACAQFTYLEPALANENARCIDVVGIREGGAVRALEPYGTYQIRVLSELRTPDDLRDRFALPERVTADVPALPGQMTLIPGALLPVVGADGLPRAVGDVVGLVATAGGRFALVEDDTLSVIGDGKDTLDDVAQGSVGGGAAAPQGAFGEDASATDNVAADFSEGAALPARPVALLPAGDWLRVIRRLDDGTASIEKVYVGANSEAARSGPSAEDEAVHALAPELRLDPASSKVGDGLRAFAYLIDDGAALLEEGANPRDAYVLLYGSAFVMVEQGDPAELLLDYFARDAPRDLRTGELQPTAWAADTDGTEGAGSGGSCANLAEEGKSPTGVDEGEGSVNVSVCYDVSAGLGAAVDLRDVEAFDLGGARRYAMSDARNDRLLVTGEDALACAGCDAATAVPLSQELRAVRVGREPLGLARSSILDCGRGDGTRSVLLVANRGSGDLSVVEEVAGELRENGVVALPAAPVGFLDDPIGPTCADPFVWVIADDGRVIPVDMRGEPSVPLCNGTACAVGTRGRGAVGAVARGASSPSRSLVGGSGLLGELGFFRPQALRGAAYADPSEIISGGEVPPSSGP